jgi:hypothetical protein
MQMPPVKLDTSSTEICNREGNIDSRSGIWKDKRDCPPALHFLLLTTSPHRGKVHQTLLPGSSSTLDPFPRPKSGHPNATKSTAYSAQLPNQIPQRTIKHECLPIDSKPPIRKHSPTYPLHTDHQPAYLLVKLLRPRLRRITRPISGFTCNDAYKHLYIYIHMCVISSATQPELTHSSESDFQVRCCPSTPQTLPPSLIPFLQRCDSSTIDQ